MHEAYLTSPYKYATLCAIYNMLAIYIYVFEMKYGRYAPTYIATYYTYVISGQPSVYTYYYQSVIDKLSKHNLLYACDRMILCSVWLKNL